MLVDGSEWSVVKNRTKEIIRKDKGNSRKEQRKWVVPV
jgi:hypothetical protein